MTWIIFALLTALFTALKGVASKKSLRSLDEFVVSWFTYALPGVFILLLLPLVKVPLLGEQFYPVLFLDCLLSVIAAVLSTKALLSDLSATIPMMAFTPLFMLLTSYPMLHEFPSPSGLVGVVLIVLGAYCLNLKERKHGFTAPFRALAREEGPRLMLIASFIWSVTGNLDKIAIQNSSPIFFAMAEYLLMALMLFPSAVRRLRKNRGRIAREKYHLLLVGVFSALMIVCQMVAVSQTLVVYVVAIKRLGILLSIILGGIVFKEKDIGLKLTGGVIMVMGILFITVF